MDTGELGARYRDVVAAAADLVDAVDRSGAVLPTLRAREALDALRAALAGLAPPRSAGPRLDPRRHLISGHQWDRDGDDRGQPRPYLFAEAAADLRRAVEGGRETESRLHQPRYDGGLAISGVRALVLAELMDELAARLRPGTAVGPIDADDSFTRLALDLADHLSSNTPF